MATQAPGATVAARKLARERMAAAEAEHKRKQAADTEDLTAFFTLGAAFDKAAAARDAAIAAAEQTYADAQARTRTGQGATLRRMRERGHSEEDLATLTGLEVREVRALLKLATAAAKPATASAPAGGTTAAGATEPGDSAH